MFFIGKQYLQAMQSDLYCFASMDIFTIIENNCLDHGRRCLSVREPPQKWHQLMSGEELNLTQRKFDSKDGRRAVGYCERRSHVRTQHGAKRFLWPPNYERCYQGFDVKFIRWVISCSKEWSWILLNLNKHALERVQHVFAVAIYVGSGESDEAPRWVGQSRVGDSAMVGAAKRPTRAMQRPSRPHSMVLRVRRRNWFRSVYRRQGWQSVESTWWEESLVEKGYTYSSLENNEAPDLNAKLNPGLTIPNH